MGFDAERAEKIVIEAAEQCERSDIPRVREPITLATAVKELKDKVDLYFAEKLTPFKYQIPTPIPARCWCTYRS